MTNHAIKISILGATGSIGQNTVKLVKEAGSRFQVQAVTASNDYKTLAQQAKSVNASLAVIANEQHYLALKESLAGTNIKVAAGQSALIEAASCGNDLVMSAIVGIAGLEPTMAAIKSGANIALANKECLVCAGEIMTEAAKRSQVKIIPVDSEHSAIYQLFDFEQIDKIERIILTASGGPFRTYSHDQMRFVTKEQALKHPNWAMGSKITIDSASLVNKGLELIEASYLFPVKNDQIEIIIHPESIIHSMVAYKDGAILAHLGVPDMCTPISYALNWPERGVLNNQRLDFAKLKQLNFEQPDFNRFPALRIATEVLDNPNNAAKVIFNSSNEVAVASFLADKINFLKITELIEKSLNDLSHLPSPKTIADVHEIDIMTRRYLTKII